MITSTDFMQMAFKHYRPLEADELIAHSIRVASNLSSRLMYDIAILHDVVEDTPVSVSDISNLFGYEVGERVGILSRSKDEEYFEYIKRVKEYGEVPMYVKIRDIEDHLSHTETLKDSLRKRYLKAMSILLEDL